MRLSLCILVLAVLGCSRPAAEPDEPTEPPPADIPRPPEGTTYYRVKALDPGFDAYSQLQIGDIILRLNGRPVYARYGGQVRDWLPQAVDEIGDKPIIVTVLRDQQEQEFEMRAKVDPEAFSEDGSPRYRIGIVVERIDYLPMHAPRGFYK